MRWARKSAWRGCSGRRGRTSGWSTSSHTPPRYDFLDPDGTLFEHFGTKVQPEELADREVAIILDLSAWNQLGDMAEYIRGFPGPRVVIDHHVSQDDLGAIFLKDTTAEATGILVMSAVKRLGGTFTREVATGLLTAIAMDTGWFRHTNTRPGTLRAAAELIESGAEIAAIYRDLFERNTLGRLQLMGETLSGLQDRAGRADRLRHDLPGRPGTHRGDPPGLRRPGRFHGQPARRRGGHAVHRAGAGRGQGLVPVAERARLRPAGRDAGGGGHRAAAGATLAGPMAESVDRVLQAVRQALDPAAVSAQR